jgi:hypothetical protein
MKTKLLALMLVAGSSLFAGPRFFFGVGFGGYGPGPGYYAPPPPPVAYYGAPAYAAPGYGYTWVGGYYYPQGPRYAWRPGYWARPPYRGSAWIAPRYYNHRYYNGYWRR